jgi:hypothetical protein
MATEIRTGTALESSDTLDAFLERWLEHTEENHSPATMQGYRVKLRNVSKSLGGAKLSDLTAQQRSKRPDVGVPPG